MPAHPPLPTPCNFPFHPAAGSHTSTLMSESLDGVSVADAAERRQVGERLRRTRHAAWRRGRRPELAGSDGLGREHRVVELRAITELLAGRRVQALAMRAALPARATSEHRREASIPSPWTYGPMDPWTLPGTVSSSDRRLAARSSGCGRGSPADTWCCSAGATGSWADWIAVPAVLGAISVFHFAS